MEDIDGSAKRGRISIIAALGKNRVLGSGGQLLWRIPDDLKRFKALTTGHSVIMGRKTWESLPEKSRPLPNRTNIVVTSQDEYQAPGAHVATSLEDALQKAREDSGNEEIFVIGGGQLYAEALPHVDRLYLTLIDDVKEGDTFFPPYEQAFTKKLAEESGESNGLSYRFVILER